MEGEGANLSLLSDCHHQYDFCIKMRGSDESH